MLTLPAGTLDVVVADRQRTGRLDRERGGAGRGGGEGVARTSRPGWVRTVRRRGIERGEADAGRRPRHRRVRDRRHSRGRDRPRRSDAVGSSGMRPAPVGGARTGCGGGGGGRARRRRSREGGGTPSGGGTRGEGRRGPEGHASP